MDITVYMRHYDDDCSIVVHTDNGWNRNELIAASGLTLASKASEQTLVSPQLQPL